MSTTPKAWRHAATVVLIGVALVAFATVLLVRHATAKSAPMPMSATPTSVKPISVKPIQVVPLTPRGEFNLVKPVCNEYGRACQFEHIGLPDEHYRGPICLANHGCGTFEVELQRSDYGGMDPLRAHMMFFCHNACTHADLAAFANALSKRSLEIIVNGKVRRSVSVAWGKGELHSFRTTWDPHPVLTGAIDMHSRPVYVDLRGNYGPPSLEPWLAVAVMSDHGLVVSSAATD